VAIGHRLAASMMLWLAFALCATAILVAGTRLSREGDEIARLTGMGGTWVGMAQLATVTSLPELMTGLSAVTMAGAPEVAVGDVLGSCVLNLAMIALLDVLQRPASVYSLAGRGHILGTAFGALMLALVGGALLLGHQFGMAMLHLSLVTPVSVLLYLFATHTIFHYERAQHVDERAAVLAVPPGALRRALIGYGLAVAVVVGAAVALPFLAVRIALALGWTQGFVGTSLVAMTSACPS